jgi:hypothetical protein
MPTLLDPMAVGRTDSRKMGRAKRPSSGRLPEAPELAETVGTSSARREPRCLWLGKKRVRVHGPRVTTVQAGSDLGNTLTVRKGLNYCTHFPLRRGKDCGEDDRSLTPTRPECAKEKVESPVSSRPR